MQSDVALFSRLLAFLIPLVVGAYWPIYSVSQGAAIALMAAAAAAVDPLHLDRGQVAFLDGQQRVRHGSLLGA